MSHDQQFDQRREGSGSGGGEPEAGGGGGALQQARNFAGVTRRAHDDCQKGADAKKKLDSRHNGPGQ